MFPSLDEQVYAKLPDAAQQLARNPRYGHLIAHLPDDRFEKLVDKASSYWEVYTYPRPDHEGGETGVIDSGLMAKDAFSLGFEEEQPQRPNDHLRRKQIRLAMAILGAIAFEMTWPTPEADEADDDLFEPTPAASDQTPPGVDLDDDWRDEIKGVAAVTRFCDNVRDRLIYLDRNKTPRCSKSCVYYLDDPQAPCPAIQFAKDWERLQAMNSHGLDHLTLSAFDQTIRFKDITLQAFFAAHWVCVYGTDEDREQVLSRILYAKRNDRGDLVDANARYREFWQFVWEMPQVVDQGFPAVDRKQRVRLLSPIYDPRLSASVRDENGDPIRSCELIYRTRKLMDGTTAKAAFRREFAELLHSDQDTSRRRIARSFVWQEGVVNGESNFLSLCRGKRGDGDNGVFPRDGDVEQFAGEQVDHFRLHRFCVTNDEFELFWPGHRGLSEFEDKVGCVDRHPVVNVSWYEAWCFAEWIGKLLLGTENYRIALPTEKQWEYACRCGQNTPYTWDAGRDGMQIELSYCNYSGFDSVESWIEQFEPVNGSTVEVCGTRLAADRIPGNVWHFHQMHGNVSEWCSDWWHPRLATFRVLRGGSWIDYGVHCRSACRIWSLPGYRNWYFGFRLAAVPVEPV
jgi:hypothetical protein